MADMGADAREGLRVATRYRPAAARRLLDVLLAAPRAVRRKPDDRYGLLAIILGTRPRLPAADLELCAAFHRAWIAGAFEVEDVAAELFRTLHEIGEAPSRERVLAVAGGTWRVLRPGPPD